MADEYIEGVMYIQLNITQYGVPSYFVATISEHTEEQIKEYIKNQKIKR